MIPGNGPESHPRISGDEAVIREFVEWMRLALEGFLNRGTDGTSYTNVFMGMVNFCRLVLEDLEERMCGPSPEERLTFRLMFLDTLQQSLLQRHPPTGPGEKIVKL